MPPVFRGRGQGRNRTQRAPGTTARSAVDLLITNARNTSTNIQNERREEIELEVAQLLQQTGLHKEKKEVKEGNESAFEKSVKSAEDVTQLGELEKKLIPPHLRYPPPLENLVNQISKDVEWAAEVTSITSKHNALRSQRVLDHLRVTPVERWPQIETVWKDLWNRRIEGTGLNEVGLLEQVFEAFEDDMNDLKEGLRRTLDGVNQEKGHLGHEVKEWRDSTIVGVKLEDEEGEERTRESKKRRIETDGKTNSQWLINYLENNKTAMNLQTGEPFWNVIDPDDEIYTDSEEEENQTVLRHAPFTRPLRRILRDIRKREEIYTVCGRSLRVFDETQDVQAIVKDNVQVIEDLFYTAEDKAKREKRQKWRQWIEAARNAQSKLSTLPSIPLSLLQCTSSVKLSEAFVKSLHFFQIGSYSNQIPGTRFGRAFFRHFAARMPHKIDSHCSSEQYKNLAWFQKYYPFDWRIPDRHEITNLKWKGILESDDTEIMKVRMATPGTRFYTGTLISCRLQKVTQEDSRYSRSRRFLINLHSLFSILFNSNFL